MGAKYPYEPKFKRMHLDDSEESEERKCYHQEGVREEAHDHGERSKQGGHEGHEDRQRASNDSRVRRQAEDRGVP